MVGRKIYVLQNQLPILFMLKNSMKMVTELNRQEVGNKNSTHIVKKKIYITGFCTGCSEK